MRLMPARKLEFPNPFYVILLIVSTAFVVTVLAYLVGPYTQQKALENPASVGASSKAMAAWFNRNGVLALTVEFTAMFACAILAMTTDQWFHGKKNIRASKNPPLS
jgi:cytochrome c biogenesis factor